jgi:hypothetical protein
VVRVHLFRCSSLFRGRESSEFTSLGVLHYFQGRDEWLEFTSLGVLHYFQGRDEWLEFTSLGVLHYFRGRESSEFTSLGVLIYLQVYLALFHLFRCS